MDKNTFVGEAQRSKTFIEMCEIITNMMYITKSGFFFFQINKDVVKCQIKFRRITIFL